MRYRCTGTIYLPDMSEIEFEEEAEFDSYDDACDWQDELSEKLKVVYPNGCEAGSSACDEEAFWDLDVEEC